MEKYQNKYRIASARLQNWDYGANALYFVTICTAHRICFFGDIIDEKMILSEIGKMAEKYWLEIPHHFPFVILHNHVIMPNHVHGIIEIAKNNGHLSPSPKSKFGPQSKNLASIIRGFKIGVTKSAKNIDPNWGWQPRFHDHIIRNYKSFQRISNYITTNPTRWKGDKFHSTI